MEIPLKVYTYRFALQEPGELKKKQPLATYKEAVDNCKQYDPGHQKRFCPRDKEQVSIWVQNLSSLILSVPPRKILT